MVWFFVAFSVLVVGLLTWGILTHRPEPETTVISGLAPWEKSKIPLQLVPADESLPPQIAHCLGRAQDFWNRYGGLELFGRGGRLVLVVAHGTTLEYLNAKDDDCADGCRSVAFTRLHHGHGGGRIQDAEVHLDLEQLSGLSPESIDRAVAHELGHVLGLGHDDVRSSIMYRAALSSKATVTAVDREWLRSSYS